MFCSPVDKYVIVAAITGLLDRKSPGPDNIGPTLLKTIAASVVEPLMYIYYLSFSSGKVPEKMKLAKVIPILKKGDPCSPSNYHPILLLNIFDKLLAKVMYARLHKHLKANNKLYNHEFGFRPNHSTSLALINALDDVYDSQKAFDSVSHDTLLAKLYNCGVRGIVYNWFESY